MQPDVCSHLAMLLSLELERGNAVAKIEARPDRGIGRFIRMAESLKVWGTPATGQLPRCVRYWDNGKSEAGFRCTEHEDVIAGPVVD
jgi:hypothetical protein